MSRFASEVGKIFSRIEDASKIDKHFPTCREDTQKIGWRFPRVLGTRGKVDGGIIESSALPAEGYKQNIDRRWPSGCTSGSC